MPPFVLLLRVPAPKPDVSAGILQWRSLGIPINRFSFVRVCSLKTFRRSEYHCHEEPCFTKNKAGWQPASKHTGWPIEYGLISQPSDTLITPSVVARSLKKLMLVIDTLQHVEMYDWFFAITAATSDSNRMSGVKSGRWWRTLVMFSL